MDANRFDTLSRQLGTVGTRRGVLRLVGTLPLLGALASLTSEQTGAETPLDQVGDRAEQHQQRQDRKDRHEQRKGKRNDGGGDQKNDGPSLRGVAVPPARSNSPTVVARSRARLTAWGRTVRTTWPGLPRVQDRSAPANGSKPLDSNCAWWFRRPWIKDAVRQRTAPRGLPAPRAPAPLGRTSALHSAHCRLPDPGRDR